MEQISLAEIHKAKCIASFHHFVKWLWTLSKAGTEFIDEPYVKFLCDHLQQRMEDMCSGIPRKGLLLAIAPATGKSFIMSVCAPIYLWLLKPESTAMCGSVNTSLALQFAVDSRTIVQHPEFQKYFPFELRDDVNSKNEFGNIQGGKRISFGLETPVIGKHSNYLQILDDVQSLNLLQSEPDRVRINNTLSQYLPSRTGNSKFAQRWLVMQRLGQQDAFAHLASFNQDEIIILPSELNDLCTNPELYNEEGLLAPRLIPRERLDSLRSSLGPAAYQAQINQNPSASENAIIRPEWIKIIDNVPTNHNARLHVFLDTAVVNTKGSDFNAAVACFEYESNLYITDIFNRKCGFLQLCGEFEAWVKGLQFFDNRTQIYVEPKASGHQVVDFLRVHSKLNVQTLPAPKVSKEQRLQSVATRIQNGRLYLVKAFWNGEVIGQLQQTCRHDDLMDATVYAIETVISETSNAGWSLEMYANGISAKNYISEHPRKNYYDQPHGLERAQGIFRS